MLYVRCEIIVDSKPDLGLAADLERLWIIILIDEYYLYRPNVISDNPQQVYSYGKEYGINSAKTLCLILISKVYMIDLLPGAKLYIYDNNIDNRWQAW